MSDVTLAIEDLTVRYRTPAGTVTALSRVSLALPRGGALAIVGESGSGKSTIALAVMGLLPSEAEKPEGRILFGGRDVLSLPPDELRRLRGAKLALVFQDPFTVLNPSLRVGFQIGEGLVQHAGLDRKAALARAVELLAEVGISDPETVARAYPHELSGGMRQRALIAGALATEPDVLVLDEPTTALDVTIEAQILDLLAELRAKRGLTLLFISHNLGVVRRVSDRVAVLYAGEVVEEGRTAAVLADPEHPYTKGLIAALPKPSARGRALSAIPGRLPDLRTQPAGCRFAPRCPFAAAECYDRQDLVVRPNRTVRCVRVAGVAAKTWPSAEAEETHERGDRGAGAIPVVAAKELEKSFTLSRGLSALRFEGFRPAYRPVRLRAVDGVSITIAAGEALGLVGESGSGKTTLGRTILRLIEPDRGTITLDGSDITRRPQKALADFRRRAQIVFQNPDSSLNPRRTVGEILARPIVRFGLAPRSEVGARVAALLDRVRLPARYADRYPHQMSGGEKQRVGIARALATEPDFIVCDEPVSALDVSVQAAIVNLLRELQDRLGVAYLFISHDIGVVAHLADRIAVMYRGRIVEIGKAADVIEPPFHPYTEALLSAVPHVDGDMTERIRLPLEPRRTVASPACVFSGRCPRRIGTICDETPPPARVLADGHILHCHHEADALSK